MKKELCMVMLSLFSLYNVIIPAQPEEHQYTEQEVREIIDSGSQQAFIRALEDVARNNQMNLARLLLNTQRLGNIPRQNVRVAANELIRQGNDVHEILRYLMQNGQAGLGRVILADWQRQQLEEQGAAARRIQRVRRGQLGRREADRLRQEHQRQQLEEQGAAAGRIQRVVRGRLAQRQLARLRQENAEREQQRHRTESLLQALELATLLS